MVDESIKYIFLSASVPIVGRDDDKYLDTADVISIRDAVIALASKIAPSFHLVWGGHPSITPLIVDVLSSLGHDSKDYVTLFQSHFYDGKFPQENGGVAKIVYTDSKKNKEESLLEMRTKMLNAHDYFAGIFIGGMDGVEEEYKLFRKWHPKAKVLPLASTGAAADIIYHENEMIFNRRLKYDLAYSVLLDDFLKD